MQGVRWPGVGWQGLEMLNSEFRILNSVSCPSPESRTPNPGPLTRPPSGGHPLPPGEGKG
jgi:hypothetical protein